MSTFDLTAIQQMQGYAEFGKAVIELAKKMGVIDKAKVVIRRPRRTAAEIEAATSATNV